MSAQSDMLQFVIRGRRCAMYVHNVKEVVSLPVITPVPLAATVIKGVMPLRGQPLAVLDLGPDLAPSRQDSHDDNFDMQRKPQDEFVLIIEAPSSQDANLVRAAVCVDQVLCVRTTDAEHMRPAPPGPAFVMGAVVDADGPALVLDATRTIEHAMAAVRATSVPL